MFRTFTVTVNKKTFGYENKTSCVPHPIDWNQHKAVLRTFGHPFSDTFLLHMSIAVVLSSKLHTISRAPYQLYSNYDQARSA